MSAFGGGKGGKGGGKKLKVTNIVETIEVGVPVRVAYNQWTQYGDFPSFMKKVEQADRDSDEKMTWKAQVFWSHREWEATVVDQRPDERIVWKSKGQKGHVDGVVTFHELAPSLTKIVVVMEYHPQGMFERTAAKLPARRVGQPEDIAVAILFVATNRFATGSTVTVDGGGTIA